MILRVVIFMGCLTLGVTHLHDYPKRFTNEAQETSDKKGKPNPAEHTPDFWYQTSFDTLNKRLNQPLRKGLAKNVILFLGDGMSISTVTAARIYLGQLNNQSGEEAKLSFEKFPFTGLSKTYCVDSQVADSGCSGTAYLAGVKNNYMTIGVTADVKYRDWMALRNSSWHTPSILQWAQESGKGTGIVTTCRVTDASPTATYAHIADRHWETDLNVLADVPDAVGVQDIASQLIENLPGQKIKVILGGGRQVFLPKEKQDEYGFNGTRGDKKDLIELWKNKRREANESFSYVTTRDQLLGVDSNSTDYLMGLFHKSHMEYHLRANNSQQPTLTDMTYAAIRMMEKEKNGYFLFIEGGLIDHGHHEDRAQIALDETVQFHRAIELATQITSEDDTLIVVTADHAHTMTINGYPERGSDIITTLQYTMDNISYSTLSYSNGPNKHRFDSDGKQHNIVADDRGNVNYTFPTIYNLSAETHEGSDVAVYSRGPSAHLLVGTFEQTVIPHVMGYAAGIGPAAVAVPRVVASAGWVSAPPTSSALVVLAVALARFKMHSYL